MRAWKRAGMLALLGASAMWVPIASAQFATGGTGLHRGRIFWVDWGNNGQNVYAGATIVRGFNVDTPSSPANRLDITCTLGNAQTTRGTAGLFVYTPGGWQGDGLDELYNIGGNQPGQGSNPNTLSVGLRTNSGATVEFNFTCSATLGGQPFALGGLVFADSESSSGTEYVAARLTGGGTLRIIDQIAQCRNTGNATRTNVTISGTPSEIRFNGPASPFTSCETNATPALRAGPILVGYIDGATSARVIVQGGGISAVAVGTVIELEFSEAIPASYGNASHVLNAAWSGGVATAGGDFNNPANLATPVLGPHLGATRDPDADANGAIGGADVDALPKRSGPAGAGYADVPPPNQLPGGTYSIANVACTGVASVAGWIDFNGNGTFDSNERSAVANCPAGNSNVSLIWTIPAGYVPQATSYMRLRASTSVTALATATGVAPEGEAEDYRIVLPQLVPTVAIAKITQGGVGTFSFTGSNGIPAQSLTTTAPGTAITGTPAPLTTAATATTVTEGASTTSQLSAISCTGLGAGGTATPDLANRSITLNAAATAIGSAITCTFTNVLNADLSVTKTNTPAAGPSDQAGDSVNSGATVNYAIAVSNNGPGSADNAVLRDPPPANMICSTATCGAQVGGAQCPGATGPALLSALQSSSGVVIPALPAGGRLTVTMTCTIN